MPSPVRQTVERIAAPSPEVFRREYLEKQKPVIMTGLFAGQAIADITSEDQARNELGWLRIPVGNEYVDAVAKRGRPDALETMRLDDYFDMQKTHPGSLRMCSEQPTPALMLQKFTLPQYDKFEDAVSSFFVGQAGQFAHMHCDQDFRQVLFHQIFGAKRFILIPPVRNRMLPSHGNFVEWSFQNMTEDEIERVLDFAGGYDCTLEAGETLFIPAAIWHYVGYTTTSMSFNIRFGRNAYTAFLAQNLHMSRFLQSIAWRMNNAESISPAVMEQYQRLVRAAEAEYTTTEERYETLDSLIEEISDLLNEDEKPQSMVNSNRFRKIYREAAIARYSMAEQARKAAAQQQELVTA